MRRQGKPVEERKVRVERLRDRSRITGVDGLREIARQIAHVAAHVMAMRDAVDRRSDAQIAALQARQAHSPGQARQRLNGKPGHSVDADKRRRQSEQRPRANGRQAMAEEQHEQIDSAANLRQHREQDGDKRVAGGADHVHVAGAIAPTPAPSSAAIVNAAVRSTSYSLDRILLTEKNSAVACAGVSVSSRKPRL
jgi:hypothetical protein